MHLYKCSLHMEYDTHLFIMTHTSYMRGIQFLKESCLLFQKLNAEVDTIFTYHWDKLLCKNTSIPLRASFTRIRKFAICIGNVKYDLSIPDTSNRDRYGQNYDVTLDNYLEQYSYIKKTCKRLIQYQETLQNWLQHFRYALNRYPQYYTYSYMQSWVKLRIL